MRALLGHLMESGKLGGASLEGRVFQTEGKAKPKAVRWGEQQSILGSERGTVWLEHRPESWARARTRGVTWDLWAAVVGHLGGHMQV